MKNTILTLEQKKREGDKITMLTAYDYSTAKLMDESGVNCILVGDSLGNVMLGYDSTLPVTMEEMIHHAKAVSRGTKNALVVADLPFMSYQVTVAEAVRNAGRLIKEGGAHTVKLEGGKEVCPQIRAITQASIPVMAHLGLTPQSVHSLGGYKVQGRETDAARKLLEDALAVEEAGAFSVVFECIPAALATWITGLLHIPTIGIGAGNGCDGQVLVYQDMLAMYGNTPAKFVKQFAAVGDIMKDAFRAYIQETKNGAFPAQEHTYKIDDATVNAVKREYEEGGLGVRKDG
ncbi:MAG: 3-methyl-2-oxobutanoate hydroxymethyltransferase [Clostridiales Family XIII bacterium]|jgi:3-methyl-2-oxobutanoate hydroxymethyltransferase|nr:3-methyl-2-oxobutanoate hydroxymethyltransferase [Clostridiales Family XIII bacterium]